MFYNLLLFSLATALVPTPSFHHLKSQKPSFSSRLHVETATATAAPAPRASSRSFSSIGPTILIHNLCNSKERTDQTIFDLLHSSDHPVFQNSQFTSIIAFVTDPKASKKRLIGRSARYTGLSDVLDFRSNEGKGAVSNVPTVESLANVKSVLSFDPVESDLEKLVANCVASSDVKSLTILLANSPPAQLLNSLKGQLDSSDISFTVIATGPIIEDVAEGSQPYRIAVEGDGSGSGSGSGSEILGIGREEALRVMTECLSLEVAAGKVVRLSGVNEDENEEGMAPREYLKMLRSEGYSRGEEVGDLISGGMEKFAADRAAKIAEKEKAAADAETNASKVMEGREEEIARLIAKGQREYEEYERKNVDKEALEFLAREWREQFFSRNTSQSEEEFIEQNMERGRKEGTRIVNMMRGTDYEGKDEHLKIDIFDDEKVEEEEKPKQEKEEKGKGKEDPKT